MFYKIANILLGIFFVGIGLNIAATGGYYSRYSYYSDYANLKIPIGVILIIIGVVIILFSLLKKNNNGQ
jgi:Kef-type K+ transport system membrane component KefB